MRAISGGTTLHSERAEVLAHSHLVPVVHISSRRAVLSGAFSTAC